MSYRREIEVAIAAAEAAGEYLKGAAGQRALADDGRDIKLEADREAEARALAVLSEKSSFGVLAEESGEHGEVSGFRWVVDPLDGTLNYNRGLPLSSVSIGLLRDETPVVGVVFDFHRDELFSGAVGEGAWCNRRAISVSETAEGSRAVLATGFPTYRDFGDASLLEFVHHVQRFKKVRLLGSAALSLAYVACGRMDAYAEDDIMLWDVAAGLAIVSAAGGQVNVTPSTRLKWGRNVRCAARSSLWAD